MALKLGDTFPNMDFQATDGNYKFHDWLGDS